MAVNVSPETENALTAKQSRAVAALLSESTIKAAAEKVSVSERQLYRWLADGTFRAELQRAQDEALDLAVTRLAGGTGAALDTLRAIMANPFSKDAARVRAAAVWLAVTLRWREVRDLAERVEALEVTIGKQS